MQKRNGMIKTRKRPRIAHHEPKKPPLLHKEKEEPSAKEDATDEVKCAICFEPATKKFRYSP